MTRGRHQPIDSMYTQAKPQQWMNEHENNIATQTLDTLTPFGSYWILGQAATPSAGNRKCHSHGWNDLHLTPAREQY